MAHENNRNGRRADGRGRANDRRENAAARARRHIAEVEDRFASEVAASVASVRVYDSMPAPKVAAPRVPTVKVVDEDSVTAVLTRGRGLASACDLAVLDFASFTSAGGGYARGAWAQEEALCAESTLYPALASQASWYAENRRRNINCSLYRNRGLVVPRVRFDREKYHSYADVIVVAAPFARSAREEYRVAEETLASAMRDRIRFLWPLPTTSATRSSCSAPSAAGPSAGTPRQWPRCSARSWRAGPMPRARSSSPCRAAATTRTSSVSSTPSPLSPSLTTGHT